MHSNIKTFNQLVPVADENYYCGDIFEAAYGGRLWCRSLTDDLLRTPLASDFKVLLKVTEVASEINTGWANEMLPLFESLLFPK